MSALFEAFKLKDVTRRNRIAVPPMCQYVARDGLVNDWHQVHLAGIARGGAGLVIVEATAVAPEGRITPGCAGIWNDEQAHLFEPIVAPLHQRSDARGKPDLRHQIVFRRRVAKETAVGQFGGIHQLRHPDVVTWRALLQPANFGFRETRMTAQGLFRWNSLQARIYIRRMSCLYE